MSPTGQEDAGFAADQHPIMIPRGAAVLAGVRLVAVSPFGDVPDEQRSVVEQRGSDPCLQRDAVPPPGDGDRPLPLHLAVQHQGAVPHRDDITGLFEEGQLGRREDACEDRAGETQPARGSAGAGEGQRSACSSPASDFLRPSSLRPPRLSTFELMNVFFLLAQLSSFICCHGNLSCT